MKSLLILAFEAFAVFGCHYLFAYVQRSSAYILLMIVLTIIAFVMAILGYVVYKSEWDENYRQMGNICAVCVFVTIYFAFTKIDFSDKTKLFTVQMTYSDGYTETKTYELPDDAEFYLGSINRYNSRTDLIYDSYPFGGSLIEKNIIRYKVISVKDK